MYGCESWTGKKAEHRRTAAFELRCWRRLLRVPWTARRSNQFILKEISLGCSLEGLMLKLKLHYFCHLMERFDSLEKTLMLGGIGSRRRGQWRMRWWMASLTPWTWIWVNSGTWWWTGRPGVLRFMGLQIVGHDWVTELNWTELSMHVEVYRQPTPVLLPGKSCGWRSLVGYSPWGDKSWTRLSNFTFTFHFLALEKEMATHSSVLTWRIPGTEEPGGLLPMGSHRVSHDWSDLAATTAYIYIYIYIYSIYLSIYIVSSMYVCVYIYI